MNSTDATGVYENTRTRCPGGIEPIDGLRTGNTKSIDHTPRMSRATPPRRVICILAELFRRWARPWRPYHNDAFVPPRLSSNGGLRALPLFLEERAA